MYIDIQQDAGQRRKPENSQDVPQKTKKERQDNRPPLKKNSQNAFAHQRKEIQMLRNHASNNIGSVGLVVNSFMTVLTITLIVAAYFSAIGQIA